MKYDTLFVIFEKAAKFEIFVCSNCRWRFMGYNITELKEQFYLYLQFLTG